MTRQKTIILFIGLTRQCQRTIRKLSLFAYIYNPKPTTKKAHNSFGSSKQQTEDTTTSRRRYKLHNSDASSNTVLPTYFAINKYQSPFSNSAPYSRGIHQQISPQDIKGQEYDDAVLWNNVYIVLYEVFYVVQKLHSTLLGVMSHVLVFVTIKSKQQFAFIL